MPKKANELKRGDRIKIGGKLFLVENVELSEIGKQGTRKCRIEALTAEKEKIVIIRPENYPFEEVK